MAGRPRTYPDEFRERAVRLVYEWRKERGVADGGLQQTADQLGINRETLRRWLIEQEVEAGERPPITQASGHGSGRSSRRTVSCAERTMAGSGGGRNDLRVGL